jgi:hypothetical protein
MIVNIIRQLRTGNFQYLIQLRKKRNLTPNTLVISEKCHCCWRWGSENEKGWLQLQQNFKNLQNVRIHYVENVLETNLQNVRIHYVENVLET